MLLSDLEAAAIGDILKHQPCTAHFIRTCFRESPAKHFSDSAGSVYPMMRRLEKNGYLESYEQQDGQRMVRYYRCTSAGKTALQRWLGPPVPESATLTVDPVRTRILYLGRLPKSRRTKWFDEIESALQAKLKLIQQELGDRDLSQSDAPYLNLADENAIMELKTRLRWLSIARRQLEEQGLL